MSEMLEKEKKVAAEAEASWKMLTKKKEEIPLRLLMKTVGKEPGDMSGLGFSRIEYQRLPSSPVTIEENPLAEITAVQLNKIEAVQIVLEQCRGNEQGKEMLVYFLKDGQKKRISKHDLLYSKSWNELEMVRFLLPKRSTVNKAWRKELKRLLALIKPHPKKPYKPATYIDAEGAVKEIPRGTAEVRKRPFNYVVYRPVDGEIGTMLLDDQIDLTPLADLRLAYLQLSNSTKEHKQAKKIIRKGIRKIETEMLSDYISKENDISAIPSDCDSD